MMCPGVGPALPLASSMLTEVYDGVSKRWLSSCLPCTFGNSVEGRRGYLSVLRPRAYWAVAGIEVRSEHNLRDGFGSVQVLMTFNTSCSVT